MIKGELKGLEGIVGETNINSGTVSLMGFRKAGMPPRVDVQASDLAHYIEVGSHVKVTPTHYSFRVFFFVAEEYGPGSCVCYPHRRGSRPTCPAMRLQCTETS